MAVRGHHARRQHPHLPHATRKQTEWLLHHGDRAEEASHALVYTYLVLLAVGALVVVTTALCGRRGRRRTTLCLAATAMLGMWLRGMWLLGMWLRGCEGNQIGGLCDTMCDCSGHGNQTGIEAARAAGSCDAGGCVCDDNYAGDYCQTQIFAQDCGEHSEGPAPVCQCTGNFLGRLCDVECGCSGHGYQTAINAARAAGTCAAGRCECTDNFAGRFCERSCGDHGTAALRGTADTVGEPEPWWACSCTDGYFGLACDVPPSCQLAMGEHAVVSNGSVYRTLDGAPADGAWDAAPNAGCQCEDFAGAGQHSASDCPSGFALVPEGFGLAPNSAESRAVVAAHAWGTTCLVLADGSSWNTQNAERMGAFGAGERCGKVGVNHLVSKVSKGDERKNPKLRRAYYTVSGCSRRVLAKCP